MVLNQFNDMITLSNAKKNAFVVMSQHERDKKCKNTLNILDFQFMDPNLDHCIRLECPIFNSFTVSGHTQRHANKKLQKISKKSGYTLRKTSFKKKKNNGNLV